MQKPFSYYVDLYISYPKTKNLNRSDFVGPTCYYTCNEKNECDMTECIQYANKKKFPDSDTEMFTKLFINELKTDRYLPHLLDGFHIQYTPTKQEKAYNLLNIIRMQPNKTQSRTGIIELNELRLKSIE